MSGTSLTLGSGDKNSTTSGMRTPTASMEMVARRPMADPRKPAASAPSGAIPKLKRRKAELIRPWICLA